MAQTLGLQDRKECVLAMQHAWNYERNDAVVDAFTLPQLE